MAAAMTADPTAFVGALSATNLALAGRLAREPGLRDRLGDSLVADLRATLVRRSRDPAADLRDRIACASAGGHLGDPRYERVRGPDGDGLLPPLAECRGGRCDIGQDSAVECRDPRTGRAKTDVDHLPCHPVGIRPFLMGRFRVTNAEWSYFMAAGGYEDERWWDTDDAKRWRRSELAYESAMMNSRVWRRLFADEPQMLEKMIEDGLFPTDEAAERWRHWMTLGDEAFERMLEAHWQPQRRTAPRHWKDDRCNGPAQPAVGICWYEARAYCLWLTAQSGLSIRLPTEVEWESAARGADGRPYPWGQDWSAHCANTYETHVRRPSPVGVFPAGDSPEGVSDSCRNVYDWTSSLWGPFASQETVPAFAYPYDPSDGREDPNAPSQVARVARGGSWNNSPWHATPVLRHNTRPDFTYDYCGFRLVIDAH